MIQRVVVHVHLLVIIVLNIKFCAYYKYNTFQ